MKWEPYENRGELIDNGVLYILLMCMQKTWCVAKPSSDEATLRANINYACSQVDCNSILKDGCPCFLPHLLINHASIAMNLYYQSRGRNHWNCYFGNSALVVTTDPSKFFIFYFFIFYEDSFL